MALSKDTCELLQAWEGSEVFGETTEITFKGMLTYVGHQSIVVVDRENKNEVLISLEEVNYIQRPFNGVTFV
jgi:hypothetical protein